MMQPSTPRTAQPIWLQLLDLLLMELSNWRWTWRSMIVTGIVAPVCSIMALGVFAKGASAETFVYILTGNVVLALMFENMGKTESRFSFMRSTGTLEFFASLPVKRWVFILAIALSFFLLSLPALIFTILFGAWFLAIPLAPHPLLFLVLPLTAFPLAAIGALIGAMISPPELGNALNNILSLFLLALGPVIVPPDRLPTWLVSLGYFSPATYAASALRQTLLGPLQSRLWLDLLMLTLYTIIVFAIVNRAISWRQR